jgi:trehalose-6-phosphatase
MARNRLTEQAIANISAAKKAELERVNGVYHVQLSSSKGKEVKVIDKMSRPVAYSSKEAAKKALLRHNENITISLKPQI